MVLLSVNTNFLDKVFVPQQLVLDFGGIYLRFDEVLLSDVDVLRSILSKLNSGKSIMLCLMGMLLDYYDVKRVLFIVDRFDNKVIFENPNNNVDVRYLFSKFFTELFEVYFNEGSLYINDKCDLLRYENFEKGYIKFKRYFVRGLKRILISIRILGKVMIYG